MASLDNKRNVSKKTELLFFSVLIGIILIIVIVCTLFVVQLKKVTHSETDRYLMEVSENVANTIDVKCQSIFKTLRSVGESYLEFEKETDKIAEQLEKNAELFEFTWLGVINAEGKSVGSDKVVESAVDVDFYQRAMQGEEVITAMLSQEGDLGTLYAVPLYNEDKIVGVSVAWNTQDRMRELLSVENFGGEGFSQIIDQEGNFLVTSANKYAAKDVNNFFELISSRGTITVGEGLEAVREDIKSGSMGSMHYHLEDGISKVVQYYPLKEGNLYLLSYVPVKVAGAKFDSLMVSAVGINAMIVVMFGVLMALLIYLNKKNNKQLMEIAFVDPVTKGYSRIRFDLEADAAIKAGAEGDYSLVSLNIKKFKLINDAFGSENGDKTLRYIQGVIISHLSSDEFVCRTSADRFSILVKTLPQEELLTYLRNIIDQINSFNESLEQKYYIAFSAGVYKIDDLALPLVSVLDRANVARKNEGGNIGHPLLTCIFYSDLERLRMLREKEIENRMEVALAKDEFVVYLQPKVNLKNNVIAGAEALVRWQDPVRGLVPPDEFIPLFERNGFIIKIDHYVFERVCAMLRKWMDNGETPIPISVNFSRAHLEEPDFLAYYNMIREKYNIPPHLLEIELTETLVFENLEMLLKVIDQIHTEGYKCSIDDFGSGYSSLNMLKDVKVDTLKLDRAFFGSPDASNIPENHVIESVVELAKKLNMRSVSEGVETILQMEYLKKINCDMVQGYVFSRPIPEENFEIMAFGAVINEVSDMEAASIENK